MRLAALFLLPARKTGILQLRATSTLLKLGANDDSTGRSFFNWGKKYEDAEYLFIVGCAFRRGSLFIAAWHGAGR